MGHSASCGESERHAPRLRTADLDYHLPRELIAQRPAQRRDMSRLLVLHRDTGAIEHRQFRDLPQYLRPGDCVVLNDTAVIPARLLGRRVPGGGRAEVLLLKPVDGWPAAGEELSADRWYALVHPGARLRPGAQVDFSQPEGPMLVAHIEAMVPDQRGVRIVRFEHDVPFAEALSVLGHVPLPPYIARPDEPEDRERYQTVYATRPGAVAAPTAGLHFTEKMLAELQRRSVAVARITLHVGLGTFRPVETELVADHKMDAEWFEITPEAAEQINRARQAGGRVVAVGTTCVRALESAAEEEGTVRPRRGETELFIVPGYRFKAVDVLLTNFHLPRSTLFALVAAFAGLETVLGAYSEAVRLRYRFYSYGDAMLII